MCYSAEASFVASGVLAGTSIAISRVPKDKPSLPLSFVPAIFATHQLIEGFVWLNQADFEKSAMESQLVFAYILIAFVFWPSFIPYATYRMEGEKRRRYLILLCQGIGLGVGVTYLLAMIRSPVEVSVEACRLSYPLPAPGALLAPYLVAVTVPFLASSRRGLPLFGVAVLFSCAAALYFAAGLGFPSVWCFFAAFLSASLYAYFRAAVPAEDRAYPEPLIHQY